MYRHYNNKTKHVLKIFMWGGGRRGLEVTRALGNREDRGSNLGSAKSFFNIADLRGCFTKYAIFSLFTI